jgi:glycine cleavage system H protein
VVFCDLPAVGAKFSKGQTLCTLESVKAVGEVYTPTDGEVVEINSELESSPNLVNQDPEDKGWLVKLKYSASSSFSDISKSMKDAVAYKDFVASQDGH